VITDLLTTPLFSDESLVIRGFGLVSLLTLCLPVLHQYFLSLFGLNIGELWDLKALGEHCKKVGRYSFLLTSVPLNVPGGIGSPPNALAIF
jgi:hypothetical protein